MIQNSKAPNEKVSLRSFPPRHPAFCPTRNQPFQRLTTPFRGTLCKYKVTIPFPPFRTNESILYTKRDCDRYCFPSCLFPVYGILEGDLSFHRRSLLAFATPSASLCEWTLRSQLAASPSLSSHTLLGAHLCLWFITSAPDTFITPRSGLDVQGRVYAPVTVTDVTSPP